MKNTSKKIKVCFYIHNAYSLFSKTKGPFGGAEIELYNLSRELAKDSNYEITFLLGDFDQNKVEYYKNIRVVKIPRKDKKNRPISYKESTLYIIKFFCKNNFDYLISQTNSAWYVTFFPVFLSFLKLIKLKYIFRIASIMDVSGTYKFGSLNFLRKFLYRFTLKNAFSILSQSEYQKQLLLKNECLNSFVVPNGFPVNHKKPLSFQDREYILWVANSRELKQPHIYLDLAKHLPDFNFVMVLCGNNSLRDNIIEQGKNIKNLTIINQVPYPEINRYFEKALCFVLTSHTEGFPNTFVQSFLAGTPIITMQFDPDNLIEKNKFGINCKNNLISAKNFILSLNENTFSQYSKRIFDHGTKNHDISKIIKLYKKIMSPKSYDHN